MPTLPALLFISIINLAVKFGFILILVAIFVGGLRVKISKYRKRIWYAAFAYLLFAPLFIQLAPNLEKSLFPTLPYDFHLKTLDSRPGESSSSEIIQAAVTPVLARQFRRPAAVWALGTCIVLFHYFFGFFSTARLASRTQQTGDERLLRLGREAAAAIGFRKSFLIGISPSVRSPSATGILRRVILLPPQSVPWSDHELVPVLCHELAHFRYYDQIWRTFARIACAFNWFNPLAWYGLRKIMIEQEIACDSASLRCGVSASGMAELLLKTYSRRNSGMIPASVSWAQKSTLKTRLHSLLKPNKSVSSEKSRQCVILGSAVALASLVTIPLSPWDVKDARINQTEIHLTRFDTSGDTTEAKDTQKRRIYLDRATHRWEWF